MMCDKIKLTKNTVFLFLTFVVTFLLFFSLKGECSVTFTKENYGDSDSIYVAGNPDFYPFEYYDKEDKEYKGLIPLMLKKVSEDTGISFVYVNSGKDNKQKYLLKNKQVDMISAFKEDHIQESLLWDKYVITTIDRNGKNTNVCIGFSSIADKTKAKAVTAAFEKISEKEINSMLMSLYSKKENTVSLKYVLIFVFVIILINAIFLFVVFRLRKKKTSKNDVDNMKDSLTGVGNGEYYTYCFNNFVSENVRSLYYVVYVSFENAKEKNILSDSELQSVQKYASKNIFDSLGSTEYISRMGDGVFSLILQCENQEKAKIRIEEIARALKKYLSAFQEEYGALFQFGVCSLADNSDCDCENAFYIAKQGYLYATNNNLLYAFGTKEIISKNRQEEKLRFGINKAIENDDFKIYLQFIVNKDTENICGAEVLSRWENNELGIMNPGQYIEIMKKTGLISKHDYYIFEKLCSLLEKWENTKYENLFLTCNFTRISISEPNFADNLKQISDKYNFNHNKLIIEITEDSLLENDEIAHKNLDMCKSYGFRIAIDDIGSGFSAITDLYDNEIDLVKIERSVVINGVTEKGNKLLNAVISLAHDMNTLVLCEGVETDEQKEMVKNTDCDMIQGYGYSRVLPYNEAMRFIETKHIEKISDFI